MVDLEAVPLDYPGFFETLNSLAHRRGGHTNAAGQFRRAHPRIPGEQSEQLHVSCIQK